MMKKNIFLAALLLIVAGVQQAWAQKVVLYTTDKGAVELDFADIDSISFSEESVAEDMWVDLGLPSGTLWATCNLGAESPEDYGYYFAWGETEPKDNYTWGTYKWMTAGQAGWDYINKYTFPDNQTDGCWYSGGQFVGDNKQELDAEDDAAKALLGSSWQIPTVAQIYELLHGDYTTAEWTTQNGVYGRKVTSKKNGNCIFLPAAGWRSGASLVGGGTTGYYWSNSLGGLTADYAFPLNFSSGYWGVEHHDRFCGHPIRPVHVVTLVSEIVLSKSELTLKQGESYRLTATVSPSDASNKAVTWESSDPSVAKVIYSGSVTAISKGTCTITCTAKDGSGTFAQCQVTVKEEDTKEYVDLGLPSGTLWATCNVGASIPEEYGDYFAWGETEPKSDYSWETYKWCDGTINSMTKYNRTDGLKELLPEDDAATANWGSDWQMPSVDQLEELFNKKYTTITWTTQNGVNGCIVTSKSNNKSIFLPAAGILGYIDLETAGIGGSCYSRSLYDVDPYDAFEMSFSSNERKDNSAGVINRKCGLSVRPVRVEKLVKEYVDLGLPSGTLWATCNVGASSPEEYGDYFAWGETEPKDNYSWSTYFDTEDEGETFKKYYNEGGLTALLPEDDAATVKWGSDWQMPSMAQQHELINSEYTTTEWTTVNGVNGRLITSKINGKSIFLPAAGTGFLYVSDGGFYWSRSLDMVNPDMAHSLFFGAEIIKYGDSYRRNGLSVRPVRVEKAAREHEYVDLGLPSGTLWATCNVGASKPEGTGDYFAWGETEPKDNYSWSTYFDTEDEGETFKKYYNEGGLTALQPEDDTATANWGSDWQMPSSEQLDELIDEQYTTTEWMEQGGSYGMHITSKVNGKSIFLPANVTDTDGTAYLGFYWSRTLSTDKSFRAYSLMVYSFSSGVVATDFERNNGHCVRPVRVEKAPKEHEYIDLGLPSGTLWATCNVGASSPEEYGNYFAWGETVPKDNYSWETYKYCEGTEQTLTKYCQNSDYGYNGYTDNRTELESKDDAATANCSGYWQTPSMAQLKELINSEYTNSEVTTQNGVNGLLITSKSNGNSIFLPAAGGCKDTNFHQTAGSVGIYWARTVATRESPWSNPWIHSSSGTLYFSSSIIDTSAYQRAEGYSVRPVWMTIN